MTDGPAGDGGAPAAATPRPRTLVMGIVNVTPDSFSDGGRWAAPADAIAHGRALLDEGADLLDIGAESTRPGFTPVPPTEQLRRLLPVLNGLADTGVPLSVDTRSAQVAGAAIAAGATIINDVSGGLGDPAMLTLVAGAGVDYICQLWLRRTGGQSDGRETIADHPRPVPEKPFWQQTADELRRRRDACLAAGVSPKHLILDPGLGFGPSPAADWETLAHLDAITALGGRILIGASRKRFLAETVAGPDDSAGEREAAGVAVTFWCAQHNIWAVRAHTAAPHRQAIAVAGRLATAGATLPANFPQNFPTDDRIRS